MKLIQNEGSVDRMVRGVLAAAGLVAGFYWLGGWPKWLILILSAVFLFTALTGSCALYLPFKFDTRKFGPQPLAKTALGIYFLVLAAAIGGGVYASIFFTGKFFLEDFNRMNASYKQTLFETGQGKRPEAIINYDLLKAAYPVFADKYSTYRPWKIMSDRQFGGDLATVRGIIDGLDEQVRTGDLAAAHKELEKIRPIFQEMFKRNGFSMLAVALVDFHDVMEVALDAGNAKDAAAVIAAYGAADEKLGAIEAEANDAEIQAIRANLEALKSAAEAGRSEELPDLAAKLKTSFVKVYLKRG